MSTVAFDVYFHVLFPGQKRAGATAEVAAEAEKETGTETATETGTEIGKRTGRDAIALVLAPSPGLAPETAIGTEKEIETEIVAKKEINLPAGLSAHPAPKKTKRETLTAGRTNMWTGLHQRSLLLVTSTMAKSPVSCSLDALFNWRDYGQYKVTKVLLINTTLT